MRQLPEEVVLAWGERIGPIVFCTVDTAGKPNAIYASIVHLMRDGRIAIADNYFDKTLFNIRSGSRASILFITKEHKAYQIKGDVEYYTGGVMFEEMLTWADPKHPRKGVVIVTSNEVYRGSDRLTL